MSATEKMRKRALQAIKNKSFRLTFPKADPATLFPGFEIACDPQSMFSYDHGTCGGTTYRVRIENDVILPPYYCEEFELYMTKAVLDPRTMLTYMEDLVLASTGPNEWKLKGKVNITRYLDDCVSKIARTITAEEKKNSIGEDPINATMEFTLKRVGGDILPYSFTLIEAEPSELEALFDTDTVAINYRN